MGAKKKAKLKPRPIHYTPARQDWAAGMNFYLRRLAEECERGVRTGWLDDDAREMITKRGALRQFNRHEVKARREASRCQAKIERLAKRKHASSS